MLSFKRAIVLAGLFITFLLVLRSTHSSKPVSPHPLNSPKSTGPYEEVVPIVNNPAPNTPASEPEKPPKAKWVSDTSNQIALAKKRRPEISPEQLRLRPLRQQLAYTFPYDSESRFPAYIWQTWKVSPSDGGFSEELRTGEASWSEMHPNFVHEVITDDVAVNLVRHFFASVPEILEAYNALPQPVLKADFFRYLILLARGGIYSDIDTRALRSAVEWVPAEVPRTAYGLVIGIEADPDRPDWKEWYSRRIQFCQWTIQAKAGHPVLVDIVATITEKTLEMKRAGTLKSVTSQGVVEFTGPAIWTDVIFNYFNDPQYFDMSTGTGNITWEKFTKITKPKKVGDVIVLPITSFSPGVQQMDAGELDDPMAFVQHSFSGSWKPEAERYIGVQ